MTAEAAVFVGETAIDCPFTCHIPAGVVVAVRPRPMLRSRGWTRCRMHDCDLMLRVLQPCEQES